MALKLVKTSASECAEHVGAGAVCASRPVQASIVEFLERRGVRCRPGAEAVKKAKAIVACEGEACLLEHPDFVGGLDPATRAAVQQDLAERFKPVGPRDSTAWLDNFNIDGTLQLWALAFPDFYCCPFAMMDFRDTGAPLAHVSMPDVYAGTEPMLLGGRRVLRPCRTFGCVLNTDVSSGGGKHWVALFVDMRGGRGRPWTVEFFNSVGNAPPRPVTLWMEETAAALRTHFPDRTVETLPVTRVTHQRSRTECGPYSLFYIRARLDGTPAEHFRREKVTDDEMTLFRQHLFRRHG